MIGIVRWFNLEKGWGWIARDDGMGDVFVHRSAIRPEWKKTFGGLKFLDQGDVVIFDLVEGDRSWRAANVAPYKAGVYRVNYGDAAQHAHHS